jgi:DNA polymerase I-like protein with 3'-5' exonuclease and polymerase domains
LESGEATKSKNPQSPVPNPQSFDVPRQIMQIHDSIMVECKEADAEKVGAMMKQVMESIYPDLGVNLKVDVSIGKNWSEL